MATAIRNGSAWTCICSAIVTETGAITTAVAALFMTSDRVIATMSTITSITTGDTPGATARSALASTPVVPVCSRAVPIGIIAPRSTTTGQSTVS